MYSGRKIVLVGLEEQFNCLTTHLRIKHISAVVANFLPRHVNLNSNIFVSVSFVTMSQSASETATAFPWSLSPIERQWIHKHKQKGKTEIE